jgi:hypothetical protein
MISFSDMEKYNIFFTFFLHKNVTFFPNFFLAERFDIFPIEKLMEKYIIFCNTGCTGIYFF